MFLTSHIDFAQSHRCVSLNLEHGRILNSFFRCFLLRGALSWVNSKTTYYGDVLVYVQFIRDHRRPLFTNTRPLGSIRHVCTTTYREVRPVEADFGEHLSRSWHLQ